MALCGPYKPWGNLIRHAEIDFAVDDEPHACLNNPTPFEPSSVPLNLICAVSYFAVPSHRVRKNVGV